MSAAQPELLVAMVEKMLHPTCYVFFFFFILNIALNKFLINAHALNLLRVILLQTY